MLVAVTGFGSVWRHRLGRQHSWGRLTQPVYYNTTGVLVNGKVCQRPQICGYARFDTVGGFDPNYLSGMLHRVFECADPSVWLGANKLLFKRLLKMNEIPDSFLVIARSEAIGQLLVGKENWRHSNTWLVSLSESKGQQEAMLAMPIGGWIRSSIGKSVLVASDPGRRRARLVLDIER